MVNSIDYLIQLLPELILLAGALVSLAAGLTTHRRIRRTASLWAIFACAG